MSKIADLVREDKAGARFIQPRKVDWNSFDIVENLTYLYCDNNQLTSLPSMPNLKYLECEYSNLTSLPSMPNLIRLDCWNNQLTTLPPMPNLKELNCFNNPLPFFTLKEWKDYWNSIK